MKWCSPGTEALKTQPASSSHGSGAKEMEDTVHARGAGHLSSLGRPSFAASLFPFLALLSQLIALFGFNLPAPALHPSFLEPIEA